MNKYQKLASGFITDIKVKAGVDSVRGDEFGAIKRFADYLDSIEAKECIHEFSLEGVCLKCCFQGGIQPARCALKFPKCPCGGNSHQPKCEHKHFGACNCRPKEPIELLDLEKASVMWPTDKYIWDKINELIKAHNENLK